MILTEEQWRERQREHRERVRPWIEPRRQRRRLGQVHPVDDFLFEYYPYSPERLTTWHPGYGVVLQGDAKEFLARGHYRQVMDGITIGLGHAAERGERLDLVVRLLSGTLARPPMVNCFGLHEWAMVYRMNQQEIRHASQPLRLSPDAIAATVEDLGLRCTHIDAYRFFTPQARPLNALTPTRATQPDLEQPGCLHAGMDLYKYSMWFQAQVGSELVADCFGLARDAREVDMAASPYDLTAYGVTPIEVETAPGRAEYAAAQRTLMQRAQPLRRRLFDVLTTVRKEVPDPASSPINPQVEAPEDQANATDADRRSAERLRRAHSC